MFEDDAEEDLHLGDHVSFGNIVLNDQTDQITSGDNLTGSALFEMVTENLSEQVRELRDINARLTNANYEKDLEIQQLKAKLLSVNIGQSSNAEDTVTGAKIVELAKAKRELTAKYESEVAKVKKLQFEKSELERRLAHSESNVVDIVSRDQELNSNRRLLSSKRSPDKKLKPCQSDPEVRQLTQKLHSAIEKASLASHENTCLKQQLQKVQKLLEREVGLGVDVSALLKEDTPGYRGRDQQIQLLKSKLDTSRKEMEALKLFDRETAEHAPSASNLSLRTVSSWKSIGKPDSNEYNHKYKEQLAHVDQRKRAEVASLTEEHEKLQKTHCELKSKTAADKARMEYLSKENNRLAQFNRHVLETCKKDAELIQYFQTTIVELRETFSKTSSAHPSQLSGLTETNDNQVLKIPLLSMRSPTSSSSQHSIVSRSSRSADYSVSKKIAQMEQEIASLKQLNSLTFEQLSGDLTVPSSSRLESSRSMQSITLKSTKPNKSVRPSFSSIIIDAHHTKRSSRIKIDPVSEPDKDSLGEPEVDYVCIEQEKVIEENSTPTDDALAEIEQELPLFQSYALTSNEKLEKERQELEDLRTEHCRTKESADMLQLKLSHLQLAIDLNPRNPQNIPTTQGSPRGNPVKSRIIFRSLRSTTSLKKL